jgi:hypothetical protein
MVMPNIILTRNEKENAQEGGDQDGNNRLGKM